MDKGALTTLLLLEERDIPVVRLINNLLASSGRVTLSNNRGGENKYHSKAQKGG